MTRRWDPEAGAWWVETEEECDACYGRGVLGRTRLDPDGYACDACDGRGTVHVERYDYTTPPPSDEEHAAAAAVVLDELEAWHRVETSPEKRRQIAERVRALKISIAPRAEVA